MQIAYSVCNLHILVTNSVREMTFERGLVATEKSPLVKWRAIVHKVNFYPLVDFVQLRYLHIIKFFTPLSSFSLCNCHRSAEFLYKSLRFLHHALWPFRRHIHSVYSLQIFLDMRGSKFSQTRGPVQQKNICPLLWEKAVICDTYTFLYYYIYYIILHLDSTLFFSFVMRVSNSRLCLPFSYSPHLMPRSSSRKRFPSQSNPHCAGHPNCMLLPATSKGL